MSTNSLSRGGVKVPSKYVPVLASFGLFVLIAIGRFITITRFIRAEVAPTDVAAAEMWERLNRTDVESLYNAACFRAVTSAILPVDPKTPAADGDRLAAEEADRAMAWLHKAVAAGFTDAGAPRARPSRSPSRESSVATGSTLVESR